MKLKQIFENKAPEPAAPVVNEDENLSPVAHAAAGIEHYDHAQRYRHVALRHKREAESLRGSDPEAAKHHDKLHKAAREAIDRHTKLGDYHSNKADGK
jgi:hypothetical protein